MYVCVYKCPAMLEMKEGSESNKVFNNISTSHY